MENPEKIVWQNLMKSSPNRSEAEVDFVFGDSRGESASSSSTATSKLKRKDQHPVRKEFFQTTETQHKCLHCGWITVMNATRMVKHILEHCQSVPEEVREEISAIQQATVEKERNSLYVAENKKDIHGLFRVENNKRVCIFCQWTTVRNLTRMRYHIVSQCTEIPMKLKSLFIKKDPYSEEPTEIVQHQDASYQVYAVDENRWDESTMDPMDYDTGGDEASAQQEPSEQQTGGSYLEIEELEERNCNYCGKAISYEVCEEDTESEIFCSDLCLQRMEKTRQLTEQVDQLKEAKRIATRKRHMNDPIEPEDQIHTKEFKLVLVSNKPPQEKPAKQIPPSAQKIKTEKEKQTSTMVEILNYTIEHDDASSFSDATSLPKTPARLKQKSPNKSVTSTPKTPSTPVQFVKRLSPRVVRSVAKEAETQTAANDEGSCHSYAGGHVYPQEDVRSADHKLQWTKAVISRPAPDFEATAVVDGAFKKIKLSDYRGKYLVFFFYPLDFTFVCPTEILAFSDRAKEFKKLNAEVIAASIDSHFTHLAWINTPRKEGGLGKINIPLVSDITHSIAKDYGVYLDDLGHTLRGLFIIDDRGILRQITMNDLPVGRSVDETLRLVQAFQYTDKHGEVCPAGWKPGQDTIVPNPEEKMKYFEKNHKY